MRACRRHGARASCGAGHGLGDCACGRVGAGRCACSRLGDRACLCPGRRGRPCLRMG